MLQRAYDHRFFTLSLLSGAGFGLTLFLVHWEWSRGFEFLKPILDIQLILTGVILLAHLFSGMSRGRQCLAMALIWPAVSAVWEGGGFFTDPAWTAAYITRTVLGFFIFTVWTAGKLAIESEEKQRERTLKQLADHTRVAQSRLKYLEARIEPEFLLTTLEEISRLRPSEMEKAVQVQQALVAYLKQSLSHTGPGPGKQDLKTRIQGLVGQ